MGNKSARVWPGLLIALLALFTACAPSSIRSSQAVGSPCLDGNSPYVSTQGTGLMVGTTPFHITTATIYPDFVDGGKTYRGSAWTHADFPAYIDQMLDLVVAAKLNTVRVTDFLSGTTDWRNPTVWQNVDTLICHAQARGLHVIISLTTFGTMLYKAGHFAYNAADWHDFLTFVGQRYQHATAIAYYAISGEALPPNGHDPLRATADQLVAFYRDTAAMLFASDGGHHLITTGGLSFLNGNYGIPWQTIFALPHIDLAAIHVYSEGDRDITLPMVSAWAAQLHKPFIVEEFGFRQNLGDAGRATAFADIFARAHTAGAAGIGFWNLGPELNPQSYDVSPATPAVWQVVQQQGA